jgi:sulfur-carrier protein adenylyltransferase/sulfurtransferase
MKEITVSELKSMMDENKDFQLIDVREPYEAEIGSIGGELIPMAEVPSNIEKISKNKPVIIHCKSGGRSGNIVHFLESQFGFDNLYNLKGGIIAWSDQIDPSVPKY